MKSEILRVIKTIFPEDCEKDKKQIISAVWQKDKGIMDSANIVIIIPNNQKSYNLLRFHNNSKCAWHNFSKKKLENIFSVKKGKGKRLRGSLYSVEYLKRLILLSDLIDESVRLDLADDYPLSLCVKSEDSGYDFTIVLAPRIE